MLVSEKDVALFARASGDRNPLHCSAEYARSTPFGTVVAHGVLAALATLEKCRPPGTGVSAVEIDFGNPVHPGLAYRTETLGESRSGTRYRLLDGDSVCLTVRVAPGPVSRLEPVPVPAEPQALVRTIDDLPPGTTVRGEYGPGDGADELAGRFPAAAALLGRLPLACLLWASHLAGMQLPGERCLLSAVALRFPSVAATGRTRLSCTARVLHTDTRFGLVTIVGQVTADGEVVAEAEIEAMVRTPVPPSSSAALGAHLSPSTVLLGRPAVVVGGSRGLGAAVALALAGQGCEVFAGHRGTFPEALLAESDSLPGRLHPVPGDAASPQWSRELSRRVEREHGRLDILVCSAAPPIRPLELAPAHLDRVEEFLVGSVRLVGAPLAGLLGLLERGRGRCLVISSSAVHEPPRDWPHYVAAKSAVEGLVGWAARHHPDVGFLVARPGMLRTEQMNSPGAWEKAEAVEPVAADLVRRLLGPAPAAGVPQFLDEPVGAGVPPAGHRLRA